MSRFRGLLRVVAAVSTMTLLSAGCTNSDSAEPSSFQHTTTTRATSAQATSPQMHSQRATVTTSGQAVDVTLYSYVVRGPGGDSAILKGTLGIAGECLVVTDSSSSQTYVPIFPGGAATLESDAAGLRLIYANHRYRINDQIELAGGAGSLTAGINCSLPGWTVSL